MFSGLGGLNPKKMQQVMKQMGISQEEIDSYRVTIEKRDNSRIIIENPSVIKINMQGQDSFQITGNITEESGKTEISEEDINKIVEKTNCSKEKARETLEKTGDLAEAILELS
jgi:nascent polypeptide-associated complex subunit alpha